jgi:hypothetical protein
MTTLVWDGANRILAADSREIWDDHLIAKTQKIYELNRKNCWIATAGSSEMGVLAVQTLNKTINTEAALFHTSLDVRFKGFNGILIYDCKPYVLLSRFVPLPILDRFYALGTGGAYALAGMHMGKNAIEAVKFAAKFDCHTDEEVQHINVPEPQKATRARK